MARSRSTNKTAATKEDPFEDEIIEFTQQGNTPQPAGPPPVVIYSNHVQMALSPWDFVMSFYHLDYGGGGAEGAAARELVRVLLSPPQAKALRDLITRQVALYEENYGEILDLAKILEVQQKKTSAH
jgi:hypothetical protein